MNPDDTNRLAAALADRYRIERELGTGGMATVWLAEDLKHGRQVAIKVLHRELAHTLGPERFLREIATTANLRHPHILPLYDSGEADGFLYYVMPFVEGDSLRERLDRERQLPIEQALRIAREVADALSYAHARGVIHRDIKPANVLLESGHAVVADFGIARAIHEAGGDSITQTGTTIGTPAYMSPEQAAGDRDLDGRSDLYALACVLYEMLAGQPPFTGPSTKVLIYQHLGAEPPPVTNLRPSVPPAVAAAIQRALAKVPADRFSPVAEFADAIHVPDAAVHGTPPAQAAGASRARSSRHLSGGKTEADRGGIPPSRVAAVATVVVALAAGAWWASGLRSGPGADAIRRLAVLPLSNLMADSSQNYFVDGMHDAMIGELGRIQELAVLSRTSTLRYRDTRLPLTEIGRELGVDGLIEGSVFRSGDSVRINVQLLRAEPERTLWTESFEGGIGEALGLHRRVAQAVAGEVRVSLGDETVRRLQAATTIDPAAQDAYLRGTAALRTRTLAGIGNSRGLLGDAVRLQSDFADAWGALAEAEYFWSAYNAGRIPRAAADSGRSRARAAADRALELDPSQPAAMTALAVAADPPWDYHGRVTGLGRTVELNPSYAQAWNLLGDALNAIGRHEEGLAAQRRAQLLDPLHAAFSRDVAFALLYMDRYAEAELEVGRALAIEPRILFGRTVLIQTLVLQERFDDAVAQQATLLEELGGNAALVDSLRSRYDAGGWNAALTWMMDLTPSDLPDAARDPDHEMLALPGMAKAFALAWLGRTDDALDALDSLFTAGDFPGYRLAVRGTPLLRSVRDEPRYRALLSRLDLE